MNWLAGCCFINSMNTKRWMNVHNTVKWQWWGFIPCVVKIQWFVWSDDQNITLDSAPFSMDFPLCRAVPVDEEKNSGLKCWSSERIYSLQALPWPQMHPWKVVGCLFGKLEKYYIVLPKKNNPLKKYSPKQSDLFSGSVSKSGNEKKNKKIIRQKENQKRYRIQPQSWASWKAWVISTCLRFAVTSWRSRTKKMWCSTASEALV